jgi:tripartite-type tricarboxylate transporter receptor subunit TctC
LLSAAPLFSLSIPENSLRNEFMHSPRRQFLQLATSAAALPLLGRTAWAQSYPSHPVRWIVTSSAGGPADTLARLMGSWLSERLGKPFVVENRTGAGGNIGTEAAVHAAPDGYTIHLTATSDAINATLYTNLNFKLLRDLAPVASLIQGPFVMLVNPTFPAKTVPEVIAFAKANPGKINFGSGGTGFASHVAGELFMMLAGVSMVHVPYRGQAPAMTDLLAGRVQVVFNPLVSSLSHLREGRLRGLAVTTTTRAEALPQVPAMSEFVPGYEASIWFGVSAPANTPLAIIERLNKEINAGLADPKIKTRLASLGSTPMSMSPPEFGKFVAAEVEKWSKVVQAAHIKAG